MTIALYLLHHLEDFLKKNWYRRLMVITDDSDRFPTIEEVLTRVGMRILKVGLDTNRLHKETAYHIDIKMKKALNDLKITHELIKIVGVKRVQWI